MNSKLFYIFNKKKEIIFLLFLLVGYVLVSSLPNLFGFGSRLFSVPYRALVFIFSLYIIFENRFLLKFKWKILILFSFFWFFYFIKAYSSFEFDYYLPEFLKQENEIYVRIFVLNFFPCVALLSIDYYKINLKLFCNYCFVILFIALVINLLYTTCYLNYYDKTSGVFAVYYISSGHFGASLVILSSYLLLFKKEQKEFDFKLLIIGLILGLFAVFVSAARSPILAIILVGFYFILLKKKTKYLYFFFVILISFFSLIYVLKHFFLFESAFIDRNYVGIFEGNTSGRGFFVSKSIIIIKNNLFVGGRVLFEDGMYPHNIFLELLMSGGVLLLTGFILIFYPLIREIKFFLKFSNSKFYILLIFAFWLQYFILVQTSYNIHSNVEFWYFSSVIIGISINIYNEKIKSNDGSRNPSRNNKIV